MKSFSLYLENPIFRSAVFSWLLCQTIKTMISVYRKRPHTPKELFLSLVWTTGGMPSSHSAVVISLATAFGFQEGIYSSVFILSLFYAFIIIRDALGVRRAAGSQAIAINQVLEELSSRFSISIKPVKEIHGHRTSEVIVGVVIGFFIAVAFCNL